MKRKYADILRNSFTYISTIICCLFLISILVYVFATGVKGLNIGLLTGDYHEELITIKTDSKDGFNKPDSEGYFSYKYGISLVDDTDAAGNKIVKVSYIDLASPLLNAKLKNDDNTSYTLEVGDILDVTMLEDKEGNILLTSSRDGAEEMVEIFDSSVLITSLQVKSPGGGARGSLMTTIYLVLLTLVLALPIGVLASIYLEIYAKEGKVKHILISLIDMTSGIPSIIFGFVGAIIFIPFCNGVFNTNGFSIIAGAFTMTLILLPTIIKTTSEQIKIIPRSYYEASLSLGASMTETVFKVILPNTIPGILTATLLSIGRIVGESAALIFVMGTAIADNISITGQSTSLALHIWSVMQSENPNYQAACAISIFILIIVLSLSLLIKFISKKLNRMVV